MRAPASCRAVITSMEGASRMSSVLGLKVSPSTATVLPRTEPPQAATTLRPMARLRWLLHAATGPTRRTRASRDRRRPRLARRAALALAVDRRHRLHQAHGGLEILGGLDQRQGVLGKARAAIARPRMEELRAAAGGGPV